MQAPPCSRSARMRCDALSGSLHSAPALPRHGLGLPQGARPALGRPGSSSKRGARIAAQAAAPRALVEKVPASLGEATSLAEAALVVEVALRKEVESEVLWGDNDSREEARKYRRTVFDFEKWRTHRSPARYARHLVGLFGSRIVWSLGRPILGVLAIGLGLGLYETARKEGIIIDTTWPQLAFQASSTLNFTNFALSLLLVFRTNSSYGRWDEARKLWGGMLNRTRDIVRQGATWFPPEERDLVEMLARWTKAFAHSLCNHLREDINLKKQVTGILTETEIEELLASTHRPLYCLQVMTEVIRASSVRDTALFRMDDNLTYFEDVVGACERIFKTPIPLSYTRHTSRTLVIWLAFLPFTIWNQQGWATIPNSAIIAFLLLGIEEIGVQIEEPFSILPLEAICGSVEAGGNQVLQQTAADSSVNRLLRHSMDHYARSGRSNGTGVMTSGEPAFPK